MSEPDELERVDAMKDEFLAAVAHALRTPLNAILGWSDMLLLRASPDSDARRGLETIVRNAQAQVQLIEDLLDLNRLLSGKIELDVRRVELLAIVEAAVDSVRAPAEAKALALRLALDPLAGPVQGDPDRLRQVVWNLLSNAVKFTPQGGSIDVSLARAGDRAEITVADSGIGIHPELLPWVFDRFLQPESSASRRFRGLGLGLAIVKRLMALHGGGVRAASAGEQQGATFVVALPLR